MRAGPTVHATTTVGGSRRERSRYMPASTSGALTPGRRGCCHPRPPQTRTCRFPASGSSRERFADGVVRDHSYRSSFATGTRWSRAVRAFSPAWLSIVVFVNRFVGLMSLPMFPVDGSLLAAPPFPPAGPGEPSSPLSQVLWRRGEITESGWQRLEGWGFPRSRMKSITGA